MDETLHQRYTDALGLKAHFHGLFNDAYRYVFPGRPGFEDAAIGQPQVEIYDSTAVVYAADLAARMQGWIAPIGGNWLKLVPGSRVPKAQHDALGRELVLVEQQVAAALSRSGLDVQLHEAMRDMIVSTGALRVWDGGPGRSVSVRAVPLSHLALEPGPFDEIAGYFLEWPMTAGGVRAQWPGANLRQVTDNTPVKVVEAVLRNYENLGTEAWSYTAFVSEGREVLDEREFVGQGSNPMIVLRWAKAPGEVYGRGPVLNALPDIRVANLVVEMTLEAAELAIEGIYNADDDGVVNPAAIQLNPGTIIPRAPGSKGLEPIEMPGRIDMSQIVLEDLRRSIRSALLSDTVTPPDARTPPSATQVVQHSNDQMARLAPAVARVTEDFYEALAARTMHILAARGEIGKPPRIAPDVAAVTAVTPLSTAKALEALDATNRWLDLVGARSPEAMGLVGDLEEYASYAARVLGVPQELVRNKAQREAHAKQIAAAMQQMQQQQGATP